MSRYRRLVDVTVLCAYACWALYYIARTSFEFDGVRVFSLWDDAMVSMRYASHLVQGRGLTWNDGERIQGFSNPGITLLMALAHLLPIAKEKLALLFQIASAGLLVASVVLVHRITRTVFDDDWAGRIAALLFMASAPVAVLTLQGTDVGVVCFLLLLALDPIARAATAPRPWPKRVFVILALAVIVRLDMALHFLVFLGLSFAFPRERGQTRFAVATLALTLLALFGFGWLYYGDPLPNTYHLKATGSPRALVLQSGLDQQLQLFGRNPYLYGFTAAALLVWFRRARLVWLVAALFAATCAYNVWVGGDWVLAHFGRFVVPALLLALMAFAGALTRTFAALVREPPCADGAPEPRLSPRIAKVLLVVTALAAAPAFNQPKGAREWFDPAADTLFHDANEASYRTAQYLRRHVDRDTVVGVYWAGIAPYFSDLGAVDVLGKADRHIARLHVPIFVPAHSKWDWDYIMNTRRPHIMLGASRGLGDRADFRSTYQQITVGAPWSTTFFMRADALDKLHDPTAKIAPLP